MKLGMKLAMIRLFTFGITILVGMPFAVALTFTISVCDVGFRQGAARSGRDRQNPSAFEDFPGGVDRIALFFCGGLVLESYDVGSRADVLH